MTLHIWLGSRSNPPRLATVGSVVLTLLFALACGSHAKAPTGIASSTAQLLKPVHFTYALVGPLGWAQVPQIVAQGKGFYASEGITVDFVVAGQSAAACQQILARAAEIGSCNLNDMVLAVESANAPLFQFVGLFALPLSYSVMARPNVKSWSDLKSKTAIVGGPKDNTAYFFRVMARSNGLKDDDYDFQYAGSSSARYQALKAGAVEAAILADPFDYQAEQDGYHRLDALVPKYVNGSNYGYSDEAARTDWAKDHSDELARFIRAQLKAVAWINDPANKQELFSLVGPKANIAQDAFERLYQRDVATSKLWSPTGQLTDAGVQGVLNSLVELGSLKQPTAPPSKYYDLTYQKLALAGIKGS